MANEITITSSLQFAKGNVGSKTLTSNFKRTWTGSNYKEGTQLIPTTAGGTAIDVSGLANVGVIWVKNNDATNPVELLNAVSGAALVRVGAGESYVFAYDTAVTAPAALAVGGSVSIQYCVLEI